MTRLLSVFFQISVLNVIYRGFFFFTFAISTYLLVIFVFSFKGVITLPIDFFLFIFYTSLLSGKTE